MPFEQAIWRIDERLSRLGPAPLARELDLETYIESDVSILNAGWLIIGRQVSSDVGPIDLLALDRNGELIIIELKRQSSTRDMTAQAIDYAAWVEDLSSDQVAGIYKRYCERWHPQQSHTTLDQAFRAKFSAELPVENLNSAHQIVLVATELDARTERIVRYLWHRGLQMNVLFFQVFSDGDRRYLSRVWMIDEVEQEEQSTKARNGLSADWNGEYYASFGIGEGEYRDWEDAVKYGYVSAGGGRWYSNTLRLLDPGGRVWVNIPGRGYVGVGEVLGPPQRTSEFQVESDGAKLDVLETIKSGPALRSTANDPEKAEYFVPVRWIKTYPLERAVSEVGLFGNQNSACKPRTPKWLHTVERLKQLFEVE